MLRRTGTTATLLVFVVCAGLHGQGNDVKLRLAQSYERSGNIEAAVKLYEEMYSKDSSNVVLFEALRRNYLQVKRYEEAAGLIERRLGGNPGDIGLLAQLGSIYTRKSDERKAAAAWEQAIALDPKHEFSYRVVAGAMIDCRQFDKAVATFQRGRTGCSAPALFTNDLANLYAIMLNYADATREYLNLLKQDQTQLGYAEARMANYTGRSEGLDAATLAVEQAVKKETDNLTYHQLLAWLYMEGKHFDRAYAVYKMMDDRLKAAGRELHYFAQTALREKAFAVASTAFQDIIAACPKFSQLAQVKFGFAQALEGIDDQRDTLNLFGAADPFAVKEHPETESEPKYGGAVAAYHRVVTEYPKTETAARSLYRIAALKQERFFYLDGARSALETLLREYSMFAPLRTEALLRLGEVRLDAGDLDGARAAYDSVAQAVQGAGQDQKEGAALHLAELDYFQDNFDAALERLKTLTRNSTSNAANDALSLQIFIQENLKPSPAALKEFAKADLLKRQRKLSQALGLFESLLQSYPKSDILDETLMNIGDVFARMRAYEKAIEAYGRLARDYPESIALDRALMKEARVFQYGINDSAKAVESYQKLLKLYPNSIYVSEARKRIRELRGDNI